VHQVRKQDYILLRCTVNSTLIFQIPSFIKILTRINDTLHEHLRILYSWFRASYLYISKIQRDATVCRSLFTSKLLYMFRVSIAPIIRSTSNCNCSFWYRTYHVSDQQPSANVAYRPRWRKVVALTRDMSCTRSCSYSLMYS
jgi:hypothetical protein